MKKKVLNDKILDRNNDKISDKNNNDKISDQNNNDKILNNNDKILSLVKLL